MEAGRYKRLMAEKKEVIGQIEDKYGLVIEFRTV
jgi:hypothetical protein